MCKYKNFCIIKFDYNYCIITIIIVVYNNYNNKMLIYL